MQIMIHIALRLAQGDIDKKEELYQLRNSLVKGRETLATEAINLAAKLGYTTDDHNAKESRNDESSESVEDSDDVSSD